MEILNALRFIVFAFSFVMFCHQLNTATINLIDPPTVLTEYERDVTDDDMPLLIICPTNQTNLSRLMKLGYFLYEGMLSGETWCNGTALCTSWGAQVNLTFNELKNQVFDLDKVNTLRIYEGKFENSLAFIPAYGLCRETSLLNYTQEIELQHRNQDDTRVFISNRNGRSYFMPHLDSHVGKEIFMKPKTKHFINVRIQERLQCKDNEKPMSELEFSKCVDEKIHKEFELNNISCVPPWLSYNRHCNQTYPSHSTFYGKFWGDFLKNYVDMVAILSNIRLEDECRQSCKETTYVVNEKGSKKWGSSWAHIIFNQKVIVTERMPNYDMFKYIIDVGSSLGLWLGLSVLGLHDLVVWAVQFFNNSVITKKIKSAVTK